MRNSFFGPRELFFYCRSYSESANKGLRRRNTTGDKKSAPPPDRGIGSGRNNATREKPRDV